MESQCVSDGGRRQSLPQITAGTSNSTINTIQLMSKGVSSASPCEPVTRLEQPRHPSMSHPATSQGQVSSHEPRGHGQTVNPPGHPVSAHPGHVRPSPAAHTEVWQEQSLTVLTSGEVGIGREQSLAGWQRWLWRRDLGGRRGVRSWGQCRAPWGQCEGAVAPGQAQLAQPSPTLTCCIGQVVLCWQQRVAEVVVVVMSREQALRGRRAGPVTAPVPRTRAPNAAAAPAAPHHPTATALPLLRRLLADLGRGKQTHAEGRDQQPHGTCVPSAFAPTGSHDADGKWGGMAKSHVEDTGPV